MRLDINLASQPYEDARQFWLRWGSAVGAAGVVTLVLLTLTITGWFNARRDRAAMAEKRAMIADRDQKRAGAEAFLNQPENRNTRDESLLLNELIERKAFSWTKVLENLERVMPPRVHLVSIHPELDEENQLALKMTVAGDSRDRAIELAQRMEESRRFADTSIIHEAHNEGRVGGDTEQFELEAVYIPEPVAPAAPEPKTKSEAKQDTKAEPKPTESNPKKSVKPKTGSPTGGQH